MAKNTATITELQKDTAALVHQAEQGGVVNITRHGKTVAFMVSQDMMEGILESLELQQDSKLMELVRKDRAGKLEFLPMPHEAEN